MYYDSDDDVTSIILVLSHVSIDPAGRRWSPGARGEVVEARWWRRGGGGEVVEATGDGREATEGLNARG